MSWFRRRKHEHEWGVWRYTLMTLSDSLIPDAPQQARHCSTCRKIEFRPGPVVSRGQETSE